MRTVRTIGIVMLLAVGISLGISWLSELDRTVVQPNGEPLVVFRPNQEVALTEASMVDSLVELELQADIRRASIHNRMLEIDLEADPRMITEEAALSDMLSIAKLGITEANNISRVFVRVVEKAAEAADERPLLLALAVGKEDFSDEDLERFRGQIAIPEEWLGIKMHYTVTERWKTYAAE